MLNGRFFRTHFCILHHFLVLWKRSIKTVIYLVLCYHNKACIPYAVEVRESFFLLLKMVLESSVKSNLLIADWNSHIIAVENCYIHLSILLSFQIIAILTNKPDTTREQRVRSQLDMTSSPAEDIESHHNHNHVSIWRIWKYLHKHWKYWKLLP